MNTRLNDLYKYVFEDASKVNLKGVPEEQIAKREKAVRETIQKKFHLITRDNQLSSSFRTALRDLKSSNLEVTLYGNNTDDVRGLVSNQFPSDDIIKKRFLAFDKECGYFSKEEKAQESYLKIFKACKLTADYVETNNANQDEVAYIHAYKLLVLFGDKLSNADAYIPFAIENAKFAAIN